MNSLTKWLKMRAATGLLKASFRLTQAEYWYRWATGRIASERTFLSFLAANGVYQNSLPVMFSKLKDKFTWRPDKVDYPKHPLVFLHDKTDDCDGYALFFEKVFRHFKIPCFRVYAKAENDRGHVVCVAMVSGSWYAFSNWDVIVLSSDSLADIGTIIARRMDSGLAYAIRCEGYSVVATYQR